MKWNVAKTVLKLANVVPTSVAECCNNALNLIQLIKPSMSTNNRFFYNLPNISKSKNVKTAANLTDLTSAHFDENRSELAASMIVVRDVWLRCHRRRRGLVIHHVKISQ